jgi:hypothetical protein
MVLPDRIELSTSPLPMECSTTELRQHATNAGIGPKAPCNGAPFLATRSLAAQARRAYRSSKAAQNQPAAAAACISRINYRPIRFPFGHRAPGAP